MGLSASQARYLQLTARRSDNEFEAQQINNSRTAIADKMEDISTKYTNGINNRQLNFVTSNGDGTKIDSVRLNYNTITAEYPNGLGYQLTDSYGTEVRPNEKNATAIREQAKADLAEAKNSKVFRVLSENENGETVQTEITGANFAEYYGNSDAVQNKNGQLVDSATFLSNISNMSATEFNQYWNSFGFSFVSGNAMDEYQDPQVLVDAQNAYEAAMQEADEIESKACIYDDRCLDSDYLEEQLRSGNWTLYKLSDSSVDEQGNLKWEQVHYGSVASISDTLYTEDDASISAEYETQMDYYQHKDKQLELQLQRLQTSHNALQTEIDSVKKVIETNVDKSFKTFG